MADLDIDSQNSLKDLLTPTDLGHVFGQTMVQGNFSSPSPMLTTSGFVKHLFHVIGGHIESRIGRGDFLIGSILISSLGSILTLLISFLLGSILLSIGVEPMMISIVFPILPFVLSVVTIVLQINLLIKRFHDLNKSGAHWIDVILGPVVIVALSGIASAFFGSLFFYSSSIGLWIFSITMMLALLWVFYLCLILIFKKGSLGTNTYGEDPLVLYGYPSHFYRWTAVILLCVVPLVQVGIGFIIYTSDSIKLLLHISSL